MEHKRIDRGNQYYGEVMDLKETGIEKKDLLRNHEFNGIKNMALNLFLALIIVSLGLWPYIALYNWEKRPTL